MGKSGGYRRKKRNESSNGGNNRNCDNEIDYSERYGKLWSDLSKLTLMLTDRKCCFPGCVNEAIEVHHVIYSMYDIRSKIWILLKDEVLPGVHIFGLCDRHHDDRKDPECAHHTINWFKGSNDIDRIDARNTRRYFKLLCEGFDEKLNPIYRKAVTKDDVIRTTRRKLF